MGNKKRNSVPDESNKREEGRLKSSKKPFDKKTYRLKKYSNKYKGMYEIKSFVYKIKFTRFFFFSFQSINGMSVEKRRL